MCCNRVDIFMIEKFYSYLQDLFLKMSVYASNSTLCTCCVVDDDLCVVVVVVWGGGLGDFLDKLSGCCGSAMSTCNSMRRGLCVVVVFAELLFIMLFVTTGGDVDVECGDWKYLCSLLFGDGVC